MIRLRFFDIQLLWLFHLYVIIRVNYSLLWFAQIMSFDHSIVIWSWMVSIALALFGNNIGTWT